jgi:hypothetical protein
MSSFISIHQYFDVPYNGIISIKETFECREIGKRRIAERMVTWYRDNPGLVIDKQGRVNHQVSKVRLLKAIYRAGDSVIGMSKRRLDAESHRYVHAFDRRPLMTVTA